MVCAKVSFEKKVLVIESENETRGIKVAEFYLTKVSGTGSFFLTTTMTENFPSLSENDT